MAYTKNEKGDAPKMRRGGRRRKKVCVFCGKENNEIDYKDVNKLKRYVSKLCKASESSDCSYQESKTHCADAVYCRIRTTFRAPLLSWAVPVFHLKLVPPYIRWYNVQISNEQCERR